MSAIKRLIVVLALAVPALAGCGQKGPLFLPGDPSSIRAPVTAPGPETDSEEDEDDETPPDGA